MNCEKGHINPTNENCTSCEFRKTCKIREIRNSASRIDNIQKETRGNFLEKIEEDKGATGCLYQIITGLIYIFGLALLAGLLQLIFTS